ncbi:hypothetical protein [Aquabacter sediminis]|uniref:hypothetical protein n=1 Tax=Aquabacter sediminis TaxID=3029197 RepID=UPI00237DADC6|nr:hypothetical protein [Aquabacter sp. P-9]MDE1568957.1 hypothetical protein [Aquabacter sp. P-9]
MLSLPSVLACAALALVLWGGPGWLLATRLRLGLGGSLALAPALGWAVQNALALPMAQLFGFSHATSLAASLLVGALALLAAPRPGERGGVAPVLLFAGAAALIALLPAAAVWPKAGDSGVLLSAPLFDHSKVALIDAILREGVPPEDPVYGGAPLAVSYYYLWHFGAAQLAGLTGTMGWAADAAGSWFTAFAALCLMGGLAARLRPGRLAPTLVLVAAFSGSLRPVLAALVGQAILDKVLEPASGLAGWLFQVSWSPHHVMAACCALLALGLFQRLATRAGRPEALVTGLVLALVLAAGFQASLWVGGITLALAGGAVVLALLRGLPPRRRLAFLALCLGAALLALGLSAPLLHAQAEAAAARGGGVPLMLGFYPVLAPDLPHTVRQLLDVPAYWLVFLPLELPLVFLPGTLWLLRGRGEDARFTRLLALFAFVSLVGGWVLVSTAGENNDLGWRAVLPGLLILIPAAAAQAAEWIGRRARAPLCALALAAVASLAGGAVIAVGNLRGVPSPSAQDFARAPDLWAAVRRHAGPGDRVANNPASFADMTPWPVNISWALLANRPSCFAGNELALAFAPLSPQAREELTDLFARVFAGTPQAGDVAAMVHHLGCRVLVVTPQDGAWDKDPFRAVPALRLVEEEPGRWRIYVAEGSGQ